MKFLKTLPLLHRLANQDEEPAPAPTERGPLLSRHFGHDDADYTVPDTAEPGGEILSANFGTDDFFAALGVARGVDTSGLPELTGMPVVLDKPVDFDSVEPADFEITLKDGTVINPVFVTPAPANGAGEQSSPLMLFPTDPENTPVKIEIVGDVISQDGETNYKGTEADVTPLDGNPRLLEAQEVDESLFNADASVGEYDANADNVYVQTVWSGGVTQYDPAADPDAYEAGADVPVILTPFDESDLQYFTATFIVDGETVELHPVAMSDNADGDNHEVLVFEFSGEEVELVSLSVDEGFASDPNGDPNEAGTVEITPLPEQHAGLYDQMIFFGDSYTDSGEIFALTGAVLQQPLPSPAFGYDGQVSNGPVYADYAPALLGIPEEDVLNYAVGGARAVGEQDLGAVLGASPLARPDPDPAFTSYDINLGAQVDRFLVDAEELGDLSGSAASITIGLNDLRQLSEVIDHESPDPAAIQAATTALLSETLESTMQAATVLAAAGVGTIILGTLPAVTRADPTPEQAFLGNVVSQYNDALIEGAAEIETLGVDVVTVDFEGMFREMTGNGSNYGFLNTENARLEGPQLIDPDGEGPLPPGPGYEVNPEIAALDPDQHVFWDTLHPTTAAHGVLGAFQAATLAGDDISFLGDGGGMSKGTSEDDLMFAQGGNDRLKLGDGDDAAFGGAGCDHLKGGTGHDILAGGDGADRVQGGRDADVVAGNAGNDRLYGGHGDDALIDGLGSDRAYSGQGNDVFFFTEAALIGGTTGTDHDVFFGGEGEDTLYLAVSAEHRDRVEAILEDGHHDTMHFEPIGLTIHGIENVELLDDRAAFDSVTVSPDLQPVLNEAELWNFI